MLTLPVDWDETQPGCPGWRRVAAKTSASGDGRLGEVPAGIDG